MSRPREPLRTWEVSEVPCLIPLIFSLASKGIIDAFPTQTHKYASPLPLNIAEGHFKPHLPVSTFPKGCTVRATFQHPTSICELTATRPGLSLGVSCETTSEQVSPFTRKYLAARPIHLNLAQWSSSAHFTISLLFFLVSSPVNGSKLSLVGKGICEDIQCKSEELVIRQQGLYLIYCHLNFHFANCSNSPTDLKMEFLVNGKVNRQTLSTWCASDTCQEKTFKTLFQFHLTYLNMEDRISVTLNHPKFLNEISLPNDNVLGVLRYSDEMWEVLWLPTAFRGRLSLSFSEWQQPAFTRLHLVSRFLSYLIARVNKELCVPEWNLKLQDPHLADVGLLCFGSG